MVVLKLLSASPEVYPTPVPGWIIIQLCTLLISTSCPAYEMFLVAQVCILDVIFSTSLSHSIFVNLLKTIGTPRYFKGKVVSMKPVIWM